MRVSLVLVVVIFVVIVSIFTNGSEGKSKADESNSEEGSIDLHKTRQSHHRRRPHCSSSHQRKCIRSHRKKKARGRTVNKKASEDLVEGKTAPHGRSIKKKVDDSADAIKHAQGRSMTGGSDNHEINDETLLSMEDLDSKEDANPIAPVGGGDEAAAPASPEGYRGSEAVQEAVVEGGGQKAPIEGYGNGGAETSSGQGAPAEGYGGGGSEPPVDGNGNGGDGWE